MARKKTTAFSDQLRQLVRDCGQTRYRIAKETGISQTILSKFVNGEGMSFRTLDTLAAYLDLTRKHAGYLGDVLPPAPLPPGLSPPVNTNNSLSFITGVAWDTAPLGKHLGQVVEDVDDIYTVGDTARAVFVGANPRNNLRLEGTFVAVEREMEDGRWERVRDDSDWELVYRWSRTGGMTGQSEVTVEWKVEEGFKGERMRLRYWGDAKAFLGGRVGAFEGVSGEFVVV